MTLPVGFKLTRINCPGIQSLTGLPWEQPTIRMYGKVIAVPRLTCWMGDSDYTYSGHRNRPTQMPEAVNTLHKSIAAVTGVAFNSVLANYYRGGSDSVSWHSDDEPELGTEPVIASLSVGATRTFQVRHKVTKERFSVALQHGDLLVMSGRSQLDYQHSVPKTTRAVGERINLTFRSIR